jgi:hypothetical protein
MTSSLLLRLRAAGRSWLPRLPAAFLLGTPFLLVCSSLQTGSFLFGEDYVGSFYYLRGSVSDTLRSGHLPHWSSSTECGSPLLATMHPGVLYPLSWLCLVVGPGMFWTLTVALHLMLSGVFGFLWLRRGLRMGPTAAAAGAAIAMLSGFVVGHVHAGHVPHLWAYTWAFAVLWRLECFLRAPSGGSAGFLAACTALMWLSGFPQFVLILSIALLARLGFELVKGDGERRLRWRNGAGAAAALAIGTCLAAPQLFPTLELLLHAQRASSTSTSSDGQFSFPLVNLVTLIVPTFFGDGVRSLYWGRWNIWENTGFVGISGLLLAGLGLTGKHRQRFLWAALAGFAILLALGPATPVHGLFRSIAPTAGFFRAPGRFLMLFTLAMAPLAGWGIETLLEEGEAVRRILKWAAVAAMTLLLLTAGTAAGMGIPNGPDSGIWKAVLDLGQGRPSLNLFAVSEVSGHRRLTFETLRSALACAAVLSGLIAVALVLVIRRKDARAWIAGGLVALLWGELFLFGARFFNPCSESGLAYSTQFVERLNRESDGPVRVASSGRRSMQHLGRSQLAGLEHVGGYNPLALREYAELIAASQHGRLDRFGTALLPSKRHPILRMLGVRYWIDAPNDPSLLPLAGGPADVLVDPAALPRAFCVSRSIVIPSRDERLRFLEHGDFDPGRVVVLERQVDLPDGNGGVAGASRATLVERSSGRYVYETDGPASRWLVLTEAWYPGWEATVDGESVPIQRANHCVQAVPVPPGKHRVSFAYHSRFFGWGGALSLAAAAGLLAWTRAFGTRRAQPALC